MMRTFWVAICCALTAVNIVQAESNRSQARDDGFNPMGIMREMPSPMNMFDSSDRRRYDHRRRHPPLHRPPVPGYPGLPYAYPPAAPVPYGYYPQHPIQGTQSHADRQGGYTPDHATQQPAAPSVDSLKQPTTPSNQRQQPATPYDKEQSAGYSFRPMTPMQQDTETIEAPFVSTEQSQPAYMAPQTIVTPPASLPATNPETYSDSQEPPLINGKPAVFRPMHLGIETPAD